MMAKSKGTRKNTDTTKKKTRIGRGKFTKWPSKGGGNGGSTPSKLYRKKYRGQGK
jgi:hypothetical protein